MQLSSNGFPRRARLDLHTPAEKAITDAMYAVEAAGCHPLLTNAVAMLGQARDKVADFVEMPRLEEIDMARQGQHYVGIKQVFAWPEDKGGRAGYAVVYRHGQPDAYRSWSPKEEFERFYLPMGSNPTRVTQDMVDGFICDTGTHATTVAGKMTVLNVELTNGTVFAESSACVDPANYDEGIGAEICYDRARDRVWHLLGFALQWARRGLKKG